MIRSMMIRRLALISLLSPLTLVGCDPAVSAGEDTDTKLVLTGSSTVAPLAAEIARRFESQNPGVRVDVQSGGSSRGIADAMSGTAHIGMASRALVDGERERLREHTIARDGVCLLVHRDNPVESLSRAQIAEVYRGQIRNWKVVGGQDAPIVVIHRADGRSEVMLFSQYVGLATGEIRADMIAGENQHALKSCAGSPHSIVYLSLGAADFAAREGLPVRRLPLDGVEPTPEAVRDGRFPLARPLNLLTRGEPRGLAARFVEFARSPAVADLVVEASYVPPR